MTRNCFFYIALFTKNMASENQGDTIESLEERMKRRETLLLEHLRKGRLGGATYFNDGERRVHYALVLPMDSLYNHKDVVEEYINNLIKLGLEFEQEGGIVIPYFFSNSLN